MAHESSDAQDEMSELDERLADAESNLYDAEMLVWEIRKEWDEVYPYDTLEWALTTIERLASKLLIVAPEDLEAQGLMEEAHLIITPAIEPEVFYLK